MHILAAPQALGRQKQWLKGIAGNSMAFGRKGNLV